MASTTSAPSGDAVEQGLLATVRERPWEHDAHRVYADLLEERGDTDRASLLRLMVARAEGEDLGARELLRDGETAAALHDLVSRVDPEWQLLVDPFAARRDKTWIAAALGGNEERHALGAAAPPLLAELLGRSVARGARDPELLWGWPSAVLARLALGAARHALVASSPSSPPMSRDEELEAVELLDCMEMVLAARDGGAGACGDAIPFHEDMSGLSQRSDTRIEGDSSRWSAVCGAMYSACRALGGYQLSPHTHDTLPDATLRAMEQATQAFVERARTRDGLRGEHTAAPSVAACTRELAEAVGPSVLAWVRAQGELPHDPLVVGEVEWEEHGKMSIFDYDHTGRLRSSRSR